MKKNKVLKIVKYNLEKNLRNKWFIGLNILLFVVALVGLNFTTVKDMLKNSDIISNDEKIKIEVVDKTGRFFDNLNKNNESDVEITSVETAEYDENIDKNRIIVEVEPSVQKIINAKIISKDGINQNYYSIIETALEKTKNEIIEEKYNLPAEDISLIKESVNIERIMVGVDNSNSDVKQMVQTIVNYLTFFILMLILSKIATDISQEKVSKSIEYVLTSISAKQYLIAKVISINLTMITQFVFTFIYFIISSSINSILNLYINKGIIENVSGFSLANISELIDTIMVMYIGIVLVFLVLTVILLCIIQAALSSKTTNISEAGNTTTILITINLILYFVTTVFITPVKESSIVVYILSCLPIVSMYFVPTMIIIGQANVFQIIVSTVLLILSIPVSLKICAKIFKNGVLDNGIKKKKDISKSEEVLKDKEIEKIERKEFAKYGYVIGMSVIIYVATQLILSYTLPLFINPVHNLLGGVISLTNIQMIVNMIIFIVSLTLPALFVKVYSTKNERSKLDFKSNLKLVLMAVPFVIIVQFGVGILLEKLGLNYDIVDKLDIYDNSSVLSNILFFVYLAILPAIFEEFYIRNTVLNISRKYGDKFAIIASSLLFSILHLNISQSLFSFIMGIILAIVTLRSNSIIPAAIIHFLNNGYAALTTIFENNNLVLNIVNVSYIVLFIIGFVLCGVSFVKNRNNIKKWIGNIKECKVNKNCKYIALDYTFVIAVILMLVLLVLTQKTLTLL